MTRLAKFSRELQAKSYAILWVFSTVLFANAPAYAEKAVLDEEKVAASIEAAITRGVDFLVTNQNKNGSFGGASFLFGADVGPTIPGSYYAFQSGTSALCVMALLESGDTRPEVTQAIKRGETWLIDNMPKVRRASIGQLYNVWGNAYGLQALVQLYKRRDAEDPLRETLAARIREQIDLLDRFAGVDGGWGYYPSMVTRQPVVGATSFTTGTVLVALHDAKQAGFKLPKTNVNKAILCLDRQRLPGFSYVYSDSHRKAPMHPINLLPGSLGRSQVCNLALRYFGSKLITDEVLSDWLEKLLHHNFWLSVGRKTIRPHESHAAVAGYFFYYGHYYAARCLEELPKEERSKYNLRLGALIASLQEEHDGSWFDFPIYNYHKYYGTGFAIMTLVRCR